MLNLEALQKYGVVETNNISTMRDADDYRGPITSVPWTDPRLKSITRLRLLSDPGFPFWDVSYCYGRLNDGSPVRIYLPFHQLPKIGYRGAIVKYAQAGNIYAKGLGILDCISCLC